MNELKMGKWFKLPVDCSHIMDDTETPGSSDSIAIDGCVALTDHHVEKVEIAINSYDKNQELIAKLRDRIESQLALLDVSGKRIERLESENDKQAEQIEIMRDALTEITKLPEVRMDEARHLACRALAQAAKD